VKTPQWLTISLGLFLVFALYYFGRTTPLRSDNKKNERVSNSTGFSLDSVLFSAKSQLKPEQVIRLNTLENSISRGNVKAQQLGVYHQLAHFWADTGVVFEPYAWYEAEAARLENSEKSLTFAARLFLENLQMDRSEERRKWKALQAKDLFEKSLTINPANDSAKIGLGACYLFGGISAAPMEGVLKIKEVVDKDSTNIYGQMMLIKGSVYTRQYDKAISRLLTVNRLQPKNVETILMLADIYERTGENRNAVLWYKHSLPLIEETPDLKTAVSSRISELEKMN
jgi:tetratricopeptide (TPR) repeat protein